MIFVHDVKLAKAPADSVLITASGDEGFQQDVFKAANEARVRFSFINDHWESLRIGFYQPDERYAMNAVLMSSEPTSILKLQEMASWIEARYSREKYDEQVREGELARQERMRPSRREK